MEIKALRKGKGGHITSIYPPGSFAAVKQPAFAAAAAAEDDDDEEVMEINAPARRTRGAVKSGRVAKPQSKGKGKEKKVRAPPVKRNEELKERLAAIKWAKPEQENDYAWEDDRWADLAW